MTPKSTNKGKRFPDQSKRLPKFRRVPDRFQNYRITSRDLEILGELARFRYLGADHVKALLSTSPEQIVSRRLQFLYHRGYLDRLVPAARAKALTAREWNPPWVYALDREGAKVLTENRTDDEAAGSWRPERNRRGAGFVLHQLGIANFRASLELALEDEQVATIEGWVSEQDLYDSFTVQNPDPYHPGRRVFRLGPDGYAVVKLRDGRHTNLFLEFDRSTEQERVGDPAASSIERKLTTLWFYTDHERRSPYWSRYATCAACGQGGNPESRFILFVTSGGEARLRNMLTTLASIHTFRGRGLRQFLFTREDSFSVKDPMSLLGPIWSRLANVRLDSKGRVISWDVEHVSLFTG